MGMLKDSWKRLKGKKEMKKRQLMGEIGFSAVPLTFIIFPNFDVSRDVYVKCYVL